MRMRKKKWTDIFIQNNQDLLIDDNILFDVKSVFGNNNDVHLEIGSGKGGFIIANSKIYDKDNFIAFEKDKTAFGVALRNYVELFMEDSKNLRFLNSYAENLPKIFSKKTIKRIFLNFSDPWPKKGYEKRRLTHNNFLKIYEAILKDDGVIEIKTDSTSLYEFTLSEVVKNNIFEIVYKTDDLYSDEEQLKYNIQTEYERKFVSVGTTIKKIVLKKHQKSQTL